MCIYLNEICDILTSRDNSFRRTRWPLCNTPSHASTSPLIVVLGHKGCGAIEAMNQAGSQAGGQPTNTPLAMISSAGTNSWAGLNGVGRDRRLSDEDGDDALADVDPAPGGTAAGPTFTAGPGRAGGGVAAGPAGAARSGRARDSRDSAVEKLEAVPSVGVETATRDRSAAAAESAGLAQCTSRPRGTAGPDGSAVAGRGGDGVDRDPIVDDPVNELPADRPTDDVAALAAVAGQATVTGASHPAGAAVAGRQSAHSGRTAVAAGAAGTDRHGRAVGDNVGKNDVVVGIDEEYPAGDVRRRVAHAAGAAVPARAAADEGCGLGGGISGDLLFASGGSGGFVLTDISATGNQMSNGDGGAGGTGGNSIIGVGGRGGVGGAGNSARDVDGLFNFQNGSGGLISTGLSVTDNSVSQGNGGAGGQGDPGGSGGHGGSGGSASSGSGGVFFAELDFYQMSGTVFDANTVSYGNGGAGGAATGAGNSAGAGGHGGRGGSRDGISGGAIFLSGGSGGFFDFDGLVITNHEITIGSAGVGGAGGLGGNATSSGTGGVGGSGGVVQFEVDHGQTFTATAITNNIVTLGGGGAGGAGGIGGAGVSAGGGGGQGGSGGWGGSISGGVLEVSGGSGGIAFDGLTLTGNSVIRTAGGDGGAGGTGGDASNGFAGAGAVSRERTPPLTEPTCPPLPPFPPDPPNPAFAAPPAPTVALLSSKTADSKM